MGGGKKEKIRLDSNFKDKYVDEYTGEIPNPELFHEAIVNELSYFNGKVWQLTSAKEVAQNPKCTPRRGQMGALQQRRP